MQSLEGDQRAAGAVVQEGLVEFLGFGGEVRRDLDFDTRLAPSGEALSGDQGLGSVTGATTRYAGLVNASTQEVCGLVRAGLQVEIECGAARHLAGLRRGDNFGVVEPGMGVEAATHDFAIAHRDRAYQRIGAGRGPAFARRSERFAHILRGHFSKSDSMNFSESKGSRSSIFSPTPM
jgi:hypothetical protein